MRLAKEYKTTVLLDGQGADETLGGYLHFFRPYLLSLFKADRAKFEAEVVAFERLHRRRFDAGWRFKFDAAVPGLMSWLGAARRQLKAPEHLNWLKRDFVEAHRTERPPFKSFDNLNEALSFFSQHYGLRNLLRFSDRNSMAFSREVRLPFLSHGLVEFVFTLPDKYKLQAGWTKRILRQAMNGIVPEAVRLRVDKLGFQPPQEEWMKCGGMRALLEESERVLLKEKIIREGGCRKETEWKTLMAGLFLKEDV
jgi:asparagine synthase (glutamine-hydrolysing)